MTWVVKTGDLYLSRVTAMASIHSWEQPSEVKP